MKYGLFGKVCMKQMAGALLAVGVFLSYSCSGEDRSGEMPRVPVVYTISVSVEGNTCKMNGAVADSHNSSLRECGFYYGLLGEKSLLLKTDTARTFMALADSLKNGEYFCVAYAKNGIGMSYGDTLYFNVEKKH